MLCDCFKSQRLEAEILILRHQLNVPAAMRRRDILAGAGSLATCATVSLPAPAIAQGIRQLKMVTDWPEATPGFHTSAVRFAQTIGDQPVATSKSRCSR